MPLRGLQLAVACILAPAALAGDLTREEAVRLLTSGISSDVVIAKLRTSTCDFTSSAEDIVQLTKRGVSQEVLQALIACERPSAASPCEAGQHPSPVAFPDLEWDQQGFHLDYVTISVSAAGLCLKRVDDQVRRPIPWSNISAICEEAAYVDVLYIKLRHPDPDLARVDPSPVLRVKGSRATVHPLYAYLLKVQPTITVSCAAMEER